MTAIIFIAIIILYLIAIGSLVYGFDKIKSFELQDLKPKTKFSIIIPFRNEAENLPKLLDSILKLNYPENLFEIILVNDNSEDKSLKVIQNSLDTESSKKNATLIGNIKIIQNQRISNSPKKDAITTAIDIAKYEWIITTDADCVMQKYWLDVFDEYIQTQNLNCIVAPVAYVGYTSFFNRFQALDFMSLQGSTIGGFGIKQPFLCNGANFAYRKSVFKKNNGFNDNASIVSGDDIFSLEKLKQYDSNKVKYLKSQEAIVYTKPVSNFKELVQQRLRWASKTSHNPNWFSKLLGVIVLLGNLACILMISTMLFGLIKLKIVVALLVIKFGIDFLLLFKTARFLKQESSLFSFIPSSMLYPFFSTYIIVLSFFKSYNWKGRTFRR